MTARAAVRVRRDRHVTADRARLAAHVRHSRRHRGGRRGAARTPARPSAPRTSTGCGRWRWCFRWRRRAWRRCSGRPGFGRTVVAAWPAIVRIHEAAPVVPAWRRRRSAGRRLLAALLWARSRARRASPSGFARLRRRVGDRRAVRGFASPLGAGASLDAIRAWPRRTDRERAAGEPDRASARAPSAFRPASTASLRRRRGRRGPGPRACPPRASRPGVVLLRGSRGSDLVDATVQSSLSSRGCDAAPRSRATNAPSRPPATRWVWRGASVGSRTPHSGRPAWRDAHPSLGGATRGVARAGRSCAPAGRPCAPARLSARGARRDHRRARRDFNCAARTCG